MANTESKFNSTYNDTKEYNNTYTDTSILTKYKLYKYKNTNIQILKIQTILDTKNTKILDNTDTKILDTKYINTKIQTV